MWFDKVTAKIKRVQILFAAQYIFANTWNYVTIYVV